MPPVTRSRGQTAVETSLLDCNVKDPTKTPIHSPVRLAVRRRNPVPPPLQTDSDVIFCDEIISQQQVRPVPTAAGQVFQVSNPSLLGGPLRFSTLQFGPGGSPLTYTTAPNFGNIPHGLLHQAQAVTLRPAGMAGQQIILYADPSLTANRQAPPRQVPPRQPPQMPPKTTLKHSLRLVRGATSSGWSVVPTGRPPDVTSLNHLQQKRPPGRSRAKRVQPILATKGVVKRQKRRSRALDTSQTRSSTSTESFRSDCLGADASSHSGSSNDDSKLTGMEASLSSRQSSLSLEEPFGVLPSYTQKQRDAMAAYFKGDPAAGTRYTSLKEWVMAKGSKFFHSGDVRLAMKSSVAAVLFDGTEGDLISADMVDAVRDVVRQTMTDERIDDFKRRLCLEIIKTRNPEYNIYEKTSAGRSKKSNLSSDQSNDVV